MIEKVTRQLNSGWATIGTEGARLIIAIKAESI